MGMTHLTNMLRFQKEGKVRIAAVCDADDNRLEAAVENAKAGGATAMPYRDYRYILERKDIDAVLIATPDHWHAVQTVHACQTGKHVYVEKPASVTVREGQAMVAAARANKVAVQVGAQARTAKGGLAHLPRHPQRHRGQGQQGHLLALRQPGGRQPGARQRAAGRTGLGPVAGPAAVAALQPALPARQLPLAAGIGRRPDPGSRRAPVQHHSVVHERRSPNLVHRRSQRPGADQGLVGLPDRHGRGLPVQEPGLDAGVGTAGQQGRTDRIRQRLLGRATATSSSNGKAATGRPIPKRSTSSSRRAGRKSIAPTSTRTST